MRTLAIAFISTVLGQPVTQFGGNWTADYRGTTYVRLDLAVVNGGAQGALSICRSIHTDAEGYVDRVTEAPSTLTGLSDVRWKDGVLSFAIPDGDDIDRFELRIIDATHADLVLMLPADQRRQLEAEGIPLPKPFRLTKPR